MRVFASGGVSIGNTSNPGAGTLRIGRSDAVSEGGQLEFCRANDNAVGWYIDSNGSAAGTSPNELRFIDFAGGSINRLYLTARGILNIGVDAGPINTDTSAVGFRGSPNNDQSGATYTLALTDAGRTIRKTVLTAQTVTIPADATVNFPLGTCIMLCNVVNANTTPAGNNLTIACAASGPSLVLFTSTKVVRTSTTNTQIAFGGSATLRKVAANLWTITGSGVS
jgi:hypothetical protein